MKGISITLYDKQLVGYDEFHKPIYEETPTTVDNVLVGEPTGSEIVDSINLTGKRLAYTLAIPKGDTHIWTDRKVEFFGETFRTYGDVTRGIEHLIPLAWNAKVKVERYE